MRRDHWGRPVSDKPHKMIHNRAQKRTRDSARRDTVLGITVLVLGVVGFYFAVTKSLPFLSPGGRLVTAYFSEPNQLEAGQTPVRVDGINVGTVNSISTADGGRDGKVVLRITNSSLQLHSDARASIEFRTLLGANFVVDVNPGSSSAPLLGKNAIPLSHTTVQTEFDDILRSFSGNTPAATREDLWQLASAMGGTQWGSLIDAAPSTLTNTAAAFRAVQGVAPSDLHGLVESAGRTTRILADDRADLETLIGQGDAATGAISSQHAALAETLDDAPSALRQTVSVSHSIDATIGPLNQLLDALGPGARELAPSAAAAEPTVEELRTVLDRAQPLLASLRPAVSALASASGPGRTLLTDLKPTINRLNSQLIPWLDSDDSDLDRPIYQLIAPTIATLGSAAAEYSADGHVLHFPIQPEANSLTLIPCTVFVAAPTPSEILNCDSLNNVLSLLLTGSTKDGAASAIPAADDPLSVSAK